MNFTETKLKGLYIINPEPRIDERGYLMRTFCEQELSNNGFDFKIVQINQTLTKKKGAIRGMHFQCVPKAEDKIVQCLRGAVYDVAVDLRPDSQTYGQWHAEELSVTNQKLFLIPKGFAHGFQTLTDNCELQYLMSEFFSPEHASGVLYDDPLFKINWPIEVTVISEKDKSWPFTSK